MRAATDTSPRELSMARGNSLESLKVVPSGFALGAEIKGIDLTLEVPEDAKEALRKAWADHLILLFRDQRIDDNQMIATADIFGRVQIAVLNHVCRIGPSMQTRV